jgi:hypothetical protein
MRTVTFRLPIFHWLYYIPLHIPISVCYFQGYSFSTCLVSFSTRVTDTSRSHMRPPNMMHRVLLRQEFERTGDDDGGVSL